VENHTYPLPSSNVTNIINIRYKGITRPVANIEVKLDWAKDPKGYHLAEGGRSKRLLIVRNGTGHGPENLQTVHPLLATNWLFRIFANTASTPEGALDFVSRYGPLTPDGWDERAGDDVNLVTFHAEYMREILRLRSGNHKGPIARIDRARIDFRRQLIVRRDDLGPNISLDAKVVWDSTAKAPRWEFYAKTLLDALWLQLGQSLTAGAQIRQCEHCRDWFEAGRGTGRRLDAKFCSDEHRVAFNSLKRSREA
jgi:hypothetical protein